MNDEYEELFELIDGISQTLDIQLMHSSQQIVPEQIIPTTQQVHTISKSPIESTFGETMSSNNDSIDSLFYIESMINSLVLENLEDSFKTQELNTFELNEFMHISASSPSAQNIRSGVLLSPNSAQNVPYNPPSAQMYEYSGSEAQPRIKSENNIRLSSYEATTFASHAMPSFEVQNPSQSTTGSRLPNFNEVFTGSRSVRSVSCTSPQMPFTLDQPIKSSSSPAINTANSPTNSHPYWTTCTKCPQMPPCVSQSEPYLSHSNLIRNNTPICGYINSGGNRGSGRKGLTSKQKLEKLKKNENGEECRNTYLKSKLQNLKNEIQRMYNTSGNTLTQEHRNRIEYILLTF